MTITQLQSIKKSEIPQVLDRVKYHSLYRNAGQNPLLKQDEKRKKDTHGVSQYNIVSFSFVVLLTPKKLMGFYFNYISLFFSRLDHFLFHLADSCRLNSTYSMSPVNASHL